MLYHMLIIENMTHVDEMLALSATWSLNYIFFATLERRKPAMSHDMWIPCVKSDYTSLSIIIVTCCVPCPLQLPILFNFSILTLGLLVI
jgi:hypothetical protein